MLKRSGLTDQLNSQPSMSELHQLLSQAVEKRGKRLQANWRGKGGIKYVLFVSCDMKGGEPHWMLFSDKKGKEPHFDYTSNDVLLVSKILTNSISEMHKPTGRYSKPNIDYSVSAPEGKELEKDKAREVTVKPIPKSEPKPEAQPPAIPKFGDLEDIHIGKIFQILNETNATGKLEVSRDQLSAVVYVQTGIPIDATAIDAVGDDALVELLTWRKGKFAYDKEITPNSQTVKKTIDELAEQSTMLTKHIQELKDRGLGTTSALKASLEKLPREDLSFGSPASSEVLLALYKCFDGKHSIEDMLRKVEISRIKLIHIVHHIVTELEAAEIINEPGKSEELVLEPKTIDTAAIQTVMMSLRRADTGMFIFPAFLYFLEQEYFRSYRARTAFSIIVFEMKEIVTVDGVTKLRPLPIDSIVEAVLRISEMKRTVDLIAHYDSLDYTMLLPNTKSSGSRIFGNRLIECIKKRPLASINPQRISITLGAASVPDDFMDLSSLLGACDLALEQAKKTKKSFVLYSDIKDKVNKP